MTSAEFQTFLTGGIGLLVVAALAIAWLLWREAAYRMSSQDSALAGVGQELKITLQRVLAELVQLSHGEFGRGSFLPTGRPQLDAVNGALIDTNRQAIAVMGAFYEELEIRKMELRASLMAGEDHDELRQLTMDSCIEGIATLFLWDEYGGVRPQDAPMTRSWDVRAWMKAHGFGGFEFPDLHLRDAVVERLRVYGMRLTPRPLTHTAHEYWSMRYDRYADPRAPFGRRRIIPASLAGAFGRGEADAEAEVEEEFVDAEPAYVAEEPPQITGPDDIVDAEIEEEGPPEETALIGDDEPVIRSGGSN